MTGMYGNDTHAAEQTEYMDPQPVATYDAVTRERDRYRKALEQITTAFCDAPSAAGMRDIARAALDPEAR